MQKKFVFNAVLLGAALIVAVVLGACAPTAGESSSAAATAPSMAEVSVQMSWTFDYSASPLYAAQKNQRFAEQNLNVTLHEGGFGSGGYIEPIDEVVSGKAEFGLSSASTLIQARAQGKPVVAVMSVLQRSPFALISLDKSHITQPKDLIGKKVTVSAGGANDVYLSFLKSQNIDPASVNTVPRTDFGIDPLLKGDVDVLAGWIINEGVMVEEAGQTPSYILPSDYGIDSYDFVVFTTDDMVKNRPDVVARFVKALVAGTDDVLANSSQAVDYTLSYAPKLDKGEQQRRVDAMLALIHPAGSEVGNMDPNVWQTTYNIVREQGSLTQTVDLSTVFTLDFLKQAYDQK